MKRHPIARLRQIDEVLAGALERPREQRVGFLTEACGADAELRSEVEALLAVEAESERLLGESATDFAAPLMSSLRDELSGSTDEMPLGSHVGPYRLVREIGRGGMGVVYLAERDDEQYRKRVALKLVKRGMDSDEVLLRFRHERQILASLEHPNIASLYDGGVSLDGRPYFVMEYVEGVPLDTYCDKRNLGVEARLALFRIICGAVHHAHQMLVVHRDLKPSNILIAADGTPRLLDFGIAKLLDEEAGPALRTRPGFRLLTPEYASPEQIRGEAVTTASDVYALGRLLFQLLSGRRPDGSGSEVLEVPTPPSGSAPSDRLRRRLRGDLDTITLKALEEDPVRRYPSAEALSNDVRRHLEGRPIEARRASAAYLGGKYLRRHRVGVGVAAAVLLLSSAFAALHTVRITAERDLAQVEAERARAAVGFVTGLFEGADPDATRGDTLNVFELLDRGAMQLDGDLTHQPAVRATLMNVLGTLYSTLGDYDRALPLLESALASERMAAGGDDLGLASPLRELARLRGRLGDYEIADSLFAASLAIQRKQGEPLSPGLPETLNQWGEMLVYIGRPADAEPKFAEALQLLEQRADDQRAEIARARFGQAKILSFAGELDRAEALHTEVLSTRREIHGDLHTDVVHSLSDMGDLLFTRREYEAAEPFMREALELRRRLLGDRHPDVSLSLNNLGTLLSQTGSFAEAESLLSESLAIKQQLLGREHRDVGITLMNIAYLRMIAGDLDGAVLELREALGIMRRSSGEESADAASVLANLAVVLQRNGSYEEAEALSREALAIRIAVHGEESMVTALRRTSLARLLHEVGKLDEAEELHRESLALRRSLQGDRHPEAANGLVALAGLLLDRVNYEEAERLLLEADAILREATDGSAADRRTVLTELVTLYQAWDRPEEAARYQALVEDG